MNSKSLYDQVYSLENYDPNYREFLYPMFNDAYSKLNQRLKDNKLDAYMLDPLTVLSYLYQEHIFNMQVLTEEKKMLVMKDEAYAKRITALVIDKVYFNEYMGYNPTSLINEHNPLVSTLDLFLNFIMNRFAVLEQNNEYKNRLLLDILKKGFLMVKSVINLLSNGFETEAFSTWRTIHEVECIARILKKYPYLVPFYLKHIKYSQYYRDEYKKENDSELIIEIRELMKPYNLKSKDTKKFIEYGWLYNITDFQTKFEDLRLNFRKGIELVAELSQLSSLYELSSEIAHSSPMLIYSNRDYFKSLAIISTYESFFRLEDILFEILNGIEEIDSSNYYSMRKEYLVELNKNISLERIIFQAKYKKK